MQFRARFGIRSIFIVVALFACALSWIAFAERRGRNQLDAVESLQVHGMFAVEPHQIDSVQTFTLPDAGGNEVTVKIPTVLTKNSKQYGVVRQLLGDKFCAKYSTVIISKDPEKSVETIAADLEKLPWLQSVYVNPNVKVSELARRKLESRFPDVEFINANQ